MFGISLVTTSATLGLLHALAQGAGTGAQTLTIAVANVISTAVRFAAMRWWIFRPAETSPPNAPIPSNPALSGLETTELMRSVEGVRQA